MRRLRASVDADGADRTLNDVRKVLQDLSRVMTATEADARQGGLSGVAQPLRRNRDAVRAALKLLGNIQPMTPLLQEAAREQAFDKAIMTTAQERLQGENPLRTSNGKQFQARRALMAAVRKHVPAGLSSERFYRLYRELV